MRKIKLAALTALCMAGVMAIPVSAESVDEKHKIGVPVYSLADEQVQAFKDYLENYIAVSFGDVEFLYSQSINSAEEEMEFLQACIDAGAEGIMAFNTYDIKAEVELCADNGVYFMRPAATPSKEEFDLVKGNPYFIGYFGPGIEMEYQAGADMADWFAGQEFGDDYFILSGGASMGNAMHIERTKGILDALQKAYGVTFDQKTEELATSAEPVTVEKDNLKVTICSGYVAMEPFFSAAKEAYEANPCSNVLGVIPIAEMTNVIGDAKLGLIDCYTSENSLLFHQGKLQYLCGKYSSIIGPAFASMYNAVTGYADDFREDGNAFEVLQGFWTSENKEDFDKKFELSSGIALNAYSVTDLLQVIKVFNPDATLDDLKKLGEQWDFESGYERAHRQ